MSLVRCIVDNFNATYTIQRDKLSQIMTCRLDFDAKFKKLSNIFLIFAVVGKLNWNKNWIGMRKKKSKLNITNQMKCIKFNKVKCFSLYSSLRRETKIETWPRETSNWDSSMFFIRPNYAESQRGDIKKE